MNHTISSRQAKRPDPTVMPRQTTTADAYANARPFSPTNPLHLQQTIGNTAVQRMILQRDDDEQASASGSPNQPEMTDATVPVPQQQQQQAQQAADSSAPTPAGEQEQPPPAPEEAQIRVPVQFNFELMPPELRIRLLEEFNFTATITAARLAWQRERFRLRLGYDYGGAITGDAQAQTGAGTFTGSTSFDPGSQVGRFGLGYEHLGWQAGLTGDTTGGLGGNLRYRSGIGTFSATGGYNFGTGVGRVGLGYEYGASLPPIDLAPSIYAAEASGRAMLGSVPGVLNDPRTLPSVISGHEGDISKIRSAAQGLGRVADLRPHGARDIDWGFYLRATGSTDNGLNLTLGAGGVF